MYEILVHWKDYLNAICASPSPWVDRCHTQNPSLLSDWKPSTESLIDQKWLPWPSGTMYHITMTTDENRNPKQLRRFLHKFRILHFFVNNIAKRAGVSVIVLRSRKLTKWWSRYFAVLTIFNGWAYYSSESISTDPVHMYSNIEILWSLRK